MMIHGENGGDEEEQEDNDNCKVDKSYDDMQLKLDLRDRVDSLFRFLNKIIESKNKESTWRSIWLLLQAYNKGVGQRRRYPV